MEKIDPEIIYPDSDGKPIGDSTIQINWIWKLWQGLEGQYDDDPNVLVACNLLWYPVEGNNRLRMAPDVMVALGHPNGERGSYRQWEEGGMAPTVVFEICSPNNRSRELRTKFRFCQRYGVEEYYLYDPVSFELQGWQRRGKRLVIIPQLDGWVSPKLGIRFDLSAGELRIFTRTNVKFMSPSEARLIRSYLENLVNQERQRADEQTRIFEQQRRVREALAAEFRELGIDLDAMVPAR